jgi:hypothetical protein
LVTTGDRWHSFYGTALRCTHPRLERTGHGHRHGVELGRQIRPVLATSGSRDQLAAGDLCRSPVSRTRSRIHSTFGFALSQHQGQVGIDSGN